MGEDIVLTDGTVLHIKINFLTVYLFQKCNLEKLMKKAEKNDRFNMEIAAKVIYCIIRSAGKNVTFDEALMLVPPDPDEIRKIIDEFKNKFEKYKKKTNEFNEEYEYEINWARLKYLAFYIGMSEEEFWKCGPFEFLEMISLYCELERNRYG